MVTTFEDGDEVFNTPWSQDRVDGEFAAITEELDIPLHIGSCAVKGSARMESWAQARMEAMRDHPSFRIFTITDPLH